jgi:hypothetical protein
LFRTDLGLELDNKERFDIQSLITSKEKSFFLSLIKPSGPTFPSNQLNHQSSKLWAQILSLKTRDCHYLAYKGACKSLLWTFPFYTTINEWGKEKVHYGK